MKVLYAAGDYPSAYMQLERFLISIKNTKHNIKTASYKLPYYNFNVDYTLDCLLNFTNPKSDISFNGNYLYYLNEIKRFKPDLIISDYDIYTANIALDLNIALWNVSPLLIYNALPKKNKYGIKKYYSHLFDANHIKNKYLKYIIKNANKNYISSYFCDVENTMNIGSFEWIRPDFILEDPIETNTVYSSIKDNQDIINKSSKYYYQYCKEYGQKLAGCDACLNDGSPLLLADSFYNQKFSNIIPRYGDIDSVMYSSLSSQCGTGRIINNSILNENKSIIKLNNNVMFLHEHLERLK